MNAPVTTERIRGLFANATAWNFSDDRQPEVLELAEKSGQEFDTWLKAHDKEVLGEAKSMSIRLMWKDDIIQRVWDIVGGFEGEQHAEKLASRVRRAIEGETK